MLPDRSACIGIAARVRRASYAWDVRECSLRARDRRDGRGAATDRSAYFACDVELRAVIGRNVELQSKRDMREGKWRCDAWRRVD